MRFDARCRLAMGAALIGSALIGPSFAWAQSSSGLDAHEHGHGELGIVVEGNTVAISLRAPGADIVGFEHEPESDEDTRAMEEAIAILSLPVELFGLPTEAGCVVQESSIETESNDADHLDEHDAHDDNHGSEEAADHGSDEDSDHGAGEAGDDDESHMAFHAEYLLACTNPEALTALQVRYFDQFAGAAELDTAVVIGDRQFTVELDPMSIEILLQ